MAASKGSGHGRTGFKRKDRKKVTKMEKEFYLQRSQSWLEGSNREPLKVRPAKQLLFMPFGAKLAIPSKINVQLYTTGIGEKLYQPLPCFNLADPKCKLLDSQYNNLHDPHLKSYFKRKDLQHRLRKDGFITSDNKVVCTVREFNQYRNYLASLELIRRQHIKEKISWAKHLQNIQKKSTSIYIRDWLRRKYNIQHQERVGMSRYFIKNDLEKNKHLAKKKQKQTLHQEKEKEHSREALQPKKIERQFLHQKKEALHSDKITGFVCERRGLTCAKEHKKRKKQGPPKILPSVLKKPSLKVANTPGTIEGDHYSEVSFEELKIISNNVLAWVVHTLITFVCPALAMYEEKRGVDASLIYDTFLAKEANEVKEMLPSSGKHIVCNRGTEEFKHLTDADEKGDLQTRKVTETSFATSKTNVDDLTVPSGVIERQSDMLAEKYTDTIEFPSDTQTAAEVHSDISAGKLADSVEMQSDAQTNEEKVNAITLLPDVSSKKRTDADEHQSDEQAKETIDAITLPSEMSPRKFAEVELKHDVPLILHSKSMLISPSGSFELQADDNSKNYAYAEKSAFDIETKKKINLIALPSDTFQETPEKHVNAFKIHSDIHAKEILGTIKLQSDISADAVGLLNDNFPLVSHSKARIISHSEFVEPLSDVLPEDATELQSAIQTKKKIDSIALLSDISPGKFADTIELQTYACTGKFPKVDSNFTFESQSDILALPTVDVQHDITATKVEYTADLQQEISTPEVGDVVGLQPDICIDATDVQHNILTRKVKYAAKPQPDTPATEFKNTIEYQINVQPIEFEDVEHQQDIEYTFDLHPDICSTNLEDTNILKSDHHNEEFPDEVELRTELSPVEFVDDIAHSGSVKPKPDTAKCVEVDLVEINSTDILLSKFDDTVELKSDFAHSKLIDVVNFKSDICSTRKVDAGKLQPYIVPQKIATSLDFPPDIHTTKCVDAIELQIDLPKTQLICVVDLEAEFPLGKYVKEKATRESLMKKRSSYALVQPPKESFAETDHFVSDQSKLTEIFSNQNKMVFQDLSFYLRGEVTKVIETVLDTITFEIFCSMADGGTKLRTHEIMHDLTEKSATEYLILKLESISATNDIIELVLEKLEFIAKEISLYKDSIELSMEFVWMVSDDIFQLTLLNLKRFARRMQKHFFKMEKTDDTKMFILSSKQKVFAVSDNTFSELSESSKSGDEYLPVCYLSEEICKTALKASYSDSEMYSCIEAFIRDIMNFIVSELDQKIRKISQLNLAFDENFNFYSAVKNVLCRMISEKQKFDSIADIMNYKDANSEYGLKDHSHIQPISKTHVESTDRHLKTSSLIIEKVNVPGMVIYPDEESDDWDTVPSNQKLLGKREPIGTVLYQEDFFKDALKSDKHEKDLKYMNTGILRKGQCVKMKNVTYDPPKPKALQTEANINNPLCIFFRYIESQIKMNDQSAMFKIVKNILRTFFKQLLFDLTSPPVTKLYMVNPSYKQLLCDALLNLNDETKQREDNFFTESEIKVIKEEFLKIALQEIFASLVADSAIHDIINVLDLAKNQGTQVQSDEVKACEGYRYKNKQGELSPTVKYDMNEVIVKTILTKLENFAIFKIESLLGLETESRGKGNYTVSYEKNMILEHTALVHKVYSSLENVGEKITAPQGIPTSKLESYAKELTNKILQAAETTLHRQLQEMFFTPSMLSFHENVTLIHIVNVILDSLKTTYEHEDDKSTYLLDKKAWSESEVLNVDKIVYSALKDALSLTIPEEQSSTDLEDEEFEEWTKEALPGTKKHLPLTHELTFRIYNDIPKDNWIDTMLKTETVSEKEWSVLIAAVENIINTVLRIIVTERKTLKKVFSQSQDKISKNLCHISRTLSRLQKIAVTKLISKSEVRVIAYEIIDIALKKISQAVYLYINNKTGFDELSEGATMSSLPTAQKSGLTNIQTNTKKKEEWGKIWYHQIEVITATTEDLIDCIIRRIECFAVDILISLLDCKSLSKDRQPTDLLDNIRDDLKDTVSLLKILQIKEIKTFAAEVATIAIIIIKNRLDKETNSTVSWDNSSSFFDCITANEVLCKVIDSISFRHQSNNIAFIDPSSTAKSLAIPGQATVKESNIKLCLQKQESILEKILRNNAEYRDKVIFQVGKLVENILTEMFQTVMDSKADQPKGYSGLCELTSADLFASRISSLGITISSEAAIIACDLVKIVLENVNAVASRVHAKKTVFKQDRASLDKQGIIFERTENATDAFKEKIAFSADAIVRNVMSMLESFATSKLDCCKFEETHYANDTHHRITSNEREQLFPSAHPFHSLIKETSIQITVYKPKIKGDKGVLINVLNTILNEYAEKLASTTLKVIKSDLDQEVIRIYSGESIPLEENVTACKIVNSILDIVSHEHFHKCTGMAGTRPYDWSETQQRSSCEGEAIIKVSEQLCLNAVRHALEDVGKQIIVDLDTISLSCPFFESIQLATEMQVFESELKYLEKTPTPAFDSVANNIVETVLGELSHIINENTLIGNECIDSDNSQQDRQYLKNQSGNINNSNMEFSCFDTNQNARTNAVSNSSVVYSLIGNYLVQAVFNNISSFALSQLELAFPHTKLSSIVNDAREVKGKTNRTFTILEVVYSLKDDQDMVAEVTISKSQLKLYAKYILNQILSIVKDVIREETFQNSSLIINSLPYNKLTRVYHMVNTIINYLKVENVYSADSKLITNVHCSNTNDQFKHSSNNQDVFNSMDIFKKHLEQKESSIFQENKIDLNQSLLNILPLKKTVTKFRDCSSEKISGLKCTQENEIHSKKLLQSQEMFSEQLTTLYQFIESDIMSGIVSKPSLTHKILSSTGCIENLTRDTSNLDATEDDHILEKTSEIKRNLKEDTGKSLYVSKSSISMLEKVKTDAQMKNSQPTMTIHYVASESDKESFLPTKSRQRCLKKKGFILDTMNIPGTVVYPEEIMESFVKPSFSDNLIGVMPFVSLTSDHQTHKSEGPNCTNTNTNNQKSFNKLTASDQTQFDPFNKSNSENANSPGKHRDVCTGNNVSKISSRTFSSSNGITDTEQYKQIYCPLESLFSTSQIVNDSCSALSVGTIRNSPIFSTPISTSLKCISFDKYLRGISIQDQTAVNMSLVNKETEKGKLMFKKHATLKHSKSEIPKVTNSSSEMSTSSSKSCKRELFDSSLDSNVGILTPSVIFFSNGEKLEAEKSEHDEYDNSQINTSTLVHSDIGFDIYEGDCLFVPHLKIDQTAKDIISTIMSSFEDIENIFYLKEKYENWNLRSTPIANLQRKEPYPSTFETLSKDIIEDLKFIKVTETQNENNTKYVNKQSEDNMAESNVLQEECYHIIRTIYKIISESFAPESIKKGSSELSVSGDESSLQESIWEYIALRELGFSRTSIELLKSVSHQLVRKMLEKSIFSTKGKIDLSNIKHAFKSSNIAPTRLDNTEDFIKGVRQDGTGDEITSPEVENYSCETEGLETSYLLNQSALDNFSRTLGKNVMNTLSSCINPVLMSKFFKYNKSEEGGTDLYATIIPTFVDEEDIRHFASELAQDANCLKWARMNRKPIFEWKEEGIPLEINDNTSPILSPSYKMNITSSSLHTTQCPCMHVCFLNNNFIQEIENKLFKAFLISGIPTNTCSFCDKVVHLNHRIKVEILKHQIPIETTHKQNQYLHKMNNELIENTVMSVWDNTLHEFGLDIWLYEDCFFKNSILSETIALSLTMQISHHQFRELNLDERVFEQLLEATLHDIKMVCNEKQTLVLFQEILSIFFSEIFSSSSMKMFMESACLPDLTENIIAFTHSILKEISKKLGVSCEDKRSKCHASEKNFENIVYSVFSKSLTLLDSEEDLIKHIVTNNYWFVKCLSEILFEEISNSNLCMYINREMYCQHYTKRDVDIIIEKISISDRKVPKEPPKEVYIQEKTMTLNSKIKWEKQTTVYPCLYFEELMIEIMSKILANFLNIAACLGGKYLPEQEISELAIQLLDLICKVLEENNILISSYVTQEQYNPPINTEEISKIANRIYMTTLKKSGSFVVFYTDVVEKASIAETIGNLIKLETLKFKLQLEFVGHQNSWSELPFRKIAETVLTNVRMLKSRGYEKLSYICIVTSAFLEAFTMGLLTKIFKIPFINVTLDELINYLPEFVNIYKQFLNAIKLSISKYLVWILHTDNESFFCNQMEQVVNSVYEDILQKYGCPLRLQKNIMNDNLFLVETVVAMLLPSIFKLQLQPFSPDKENLLSYPSHVFTCDNDYTLQANGSSANNYLFCSTQTSSCTETYREQFQDEKISIISWCMNDDTLNYLHHLVSEIVSNIFSFESDNYSTLKSEQEQKLIDSIFHEIAAEVAKLKNQQNKIYSQKNEIIKKVVASIIQKLIKAYEPDFILIMAKNNDKNLVWKISTLIMSEMSDCKLNMDLSYYTSSESSEELEIYKMNLFSIFIEEIVTRILLLMVCASHNFPNINNVEILMETKFNEIKAMLKNAVITDIEKERKDMGNISFDNFMSKDLNNITASVCNNLILKYKSKMKVCEELKNGNKISINFIVKLISKEISVQKYQSPSLLCGETSSECYTYAEPDFILEQTNSDQFSGEFTTKEDTSTEYKLEIAREEILPHASYNRMMSLSLLQDTISELMVKIFPPFCTLTKSTGIRSSLSEPQFKEVACTLTRKAALEFSKKNIWVTNVEGITQYYNSQNIFYVVNILYGCISEQYQTIQKLKKAVIKGDCMLIQGIVNLLSSKTFQYLSHPIGLGASSISSFYSDTTNSLAGTSFYTLDVSFGNQKHSVIPQYVFARTFLEDIICGLLIQVFDSNSVFVKNKNVHRKPFVKYKDLLSKVMDSILHELMASQIMIIDKDDVLSDKRNENIEQIINCVLKNLVEEFEYQCIDLVYNSKIFSQALVRLLLPYTQRHFLTEELSLYRCSTLKSENIIQKVLNETCNESPTSSINILCSTSFFEKIIITFFQKLINSLSYVQEIKSTSVISQTKLAEIVITLVNCLFFELSGNQEVPEIKSVNPKQAKYIYKVIGESVYKKVLHKSGSYVHLHANLNNKDNDFVKQLATLITIEISSYQFLKCSVEHLYELLINIDINRVTRNILPNASICLPCPIVRNQGKDKAVVTEHKVLDFEKYEILPIKMIPHFYDQPLKIDPSIISDHLAVISMKKEPINFLEEHFSAQSGFSFKNVRKSSIHNKSIQSSSNISFSIIPYDDIFTRKGKESCLKTPGRLAVTAKEIVGRHSFYNLMKPDLAKVELLKDVKSKQELIAHLMAHDIDHYNKKEKKINKNNTE